MMVSPDLSNEDDFSTVVGTAHTAGLAAWPGIVLSIEAFAGHVETLLGRERGARTLQLHGDDVFLACACASGDPRAIEHFSLAFLGAVPAAVSRILADEALVADLVQTLHEMLLVRRDDASPPRIAEYRGTGSLAGWVRVTATRAAVRMKRGAGRFAKANEGELADRVATTTIGPERAYMSRRYGPAFEEALRESLAELAAEQRDVLRRYYVDGLTIDELAEREGIHRATAARRVDAARKRILAGVRRRAAARLQIADEEVDSLMGLVASRLEISLRTFVPTDDSQ